MLNRRVLIVEAQVKQYRAPFYQKLYDALAKNGISLRVGYSDPPSSESARADNVTLPIEFGVKVKSQWGFGERLLYMPLVREAAAADLMIVEQANKHVLNHVLLPLSALRIKKLAFWGLAENKQADRLSISEWYKRLTLNWVTWWFAYTEGTAQFLSENGVPRWKITAVNNAVDTHEIRDIARSLDPIELASVRAQLGIGPDDPVGVYCGMLEPVKALGFLIEAARKIRESLPRFHLIIIGGGPDRDLVVDRSRDAPWIHYMGPRFGREKVRLLKLADALLVPGRVGLVILDGFAIGLPLLTTALSNHGPEIEYLSHGVNGLVTEHETAAYAREVAALLGDRSRLRALQAAATAAGQAHTIETMVDRFREGIETCLSMGRSHRLGGGA
jgi:glycosyltransferase involved in cell wall biosynthesis